MQVGHLPGDMGYLPGTVEEKLRGIDMISEADHAYDIASGDLLNPLYDQVVKEYEEAQAWLTRCENKLVQAVKLTDHDELKARTAPPQVTGVSSILAHLRSRSVA